MSALNMKPLNCLYEQVLKTLDSSAVLFSVSWSWSINPILPGPGGVRHAPHEIFAHN